MQSWIQERELHLVQIHNYVGLRRFLVLENLISCADQPCLAPEIVNLL